MTLVLRGVRRYRGMTARSVADAMGLPLRSFEHFEAGMGRINIQRLHDFAQATDSDPLAIWAAILMGAPDFAVRCADNKMMLTFLIALQEFHETAGAQIRQFDTASLITAITQMFEALSQDAGERQALARIWLQRDPTTKKEAPTEDGDDAAADPS